jgi:hypothetical protein
MSWASHRKAVRDASRPLPHRASHLRSCATRVAHILGMTRETFFSRIRSESGLDLERIDEERSSLAAMVHIEALRHRRDGA